MKGLLHRLAARAAGTALPVRSNARLPFGGTGLGETVDSEGEAKEHSVPAPLVREHTAEASNVSGNLRSAPARDLPARMMDMPMRRRQEQFANTKAAATHDTRGDAAATLPAAPAAAADVDSKLPQQLVNLASINTVEGIPRNSTSTLEAARETAVLHPQEARRVDRIIDEPSLLVPHAPSRRAPAPKDSARAVARERAWPNPGRAASDEPTEVHIHIGRIDVTAVHESTPPRRRPAPTSSPMSLDAYLAKRGRT